MTHAHKNLTGGLRKPPQATEPQEGDPSAPQRGRGGRREAPSPNARASSAPTGVTPSPSSRQERGREPAAGRGEPASAVAKVTHPSGPALRHLSGGRAGRLRGRAGPAARAGGRTYAGARRGGDCPRPLARDLGRLRRLFAAGPGRRVRRAGRGGTGPEPGWIPARRCSGAAEVWRPRFPVRRCLLRGRSLC